MADKDKTDVKETIETLSVRISAVTDDLKALETSVRGFVTDTNAKIGAIVHRHSAKLEETQHYCTDCGNPVGAMDRCSVHPAAKINHSGIDPVTGTAKVMRTT